MHQNTTTSALFLFWVVSKCSQPTGFAAARSSNKTISQLTPAQFLNGKKHIERNTNLSGRLVTDEPFGAVNDVFGASFGAFLLKEAGDAERLGTNLQSVADFGRHGQTITCPARKPTAGNKELQTYVWRDGSFLGSHAYG